MKKPLRLFTAVWGEKHLDWFEKFCLYSLSWPENSLALKDATWVFVSKEPEQRRLAELVHKYKIPIRNIEFITLGPDFDQNPHAAGQFMNQALLIEINACITLGAQSFTAPPDTIFGDGTVLGLLALGQQKDTVVFAAHPRVHPDIDDTLVKCEFLTNPELVSAAWKSLHKTWSEAWSGAERINSYVGGVSWNIIKPNLFAITHRLPTPYLINWTPEDFVYFKNQVHFGVIDHSWPSGGLIESERMRICGSSDVAFMCEVTEPENNVPPLAHFHEPDHFWRNLPHNKINRMFKIIFRGA